jgi:hypothetical protein
VSGQELYNLDPAFERSLVTITCSKPQFFARIGEVINPELLNIEPATLSLRAAQAIAKSTGSGPDSLCIITQRLRLWHHEGNVTQEQIDDVMDMFDESLDAGLPSEEIVLGEIVPVLQRRIRDKATRMAIDELGKHGDMLSVADLITRASRLGDSTVTSDGSFVGDEAFDEIAAIASLDRLPTGITELDVELQGGFERGSLFVFAGGAGDGKSIALAQCAAEAALHGYNVAYATLELSRARTLTRIMANITAIPIDALLNGSMEKARRRFSYIEDTRDMGFFKVEYFTAGATTLEDIKLWVARLEQKYKTKIHAVVVDYGDLLTLLEAERKGGYVDMGVIFGGFRVWMEATGRWGISGSQSKRKERKQRRITIDDLADSQHKARVADGIITLNVKDEGESIELFIAKNRNGISRRTVGPLPTDWDCARLAPTNRDYEVDHDILDEDFSTEFAFN